MPCGDSSDYSRSEPSGYVSNLEYALCILCKKLSAKEMTDIKFTNRTYYGNDLFSWYHIHNSIDSHSSEKDRSDLAIKEIDRIHKELSIN